MKNILSNIDSHPIFLGPHGRLLYLLQAKMMLEYTTNHKKVMDEINALRTPSWIKNLEKNVDPRLEKVKLKAREIG